MQRDTTEWNIIRANQLAALIDAAEERPTKLLNEWYGCVSWIRKYGNVADVTETIICPANW